MPQKVTVADAQKSEVHDATADASTSPTADGDASTTKTVARAPEGDHSHYDPPPLTGHTTVVRDDTSDGGPLVIESDDPALNPPRPPFDPFPTDGTPQIDGPVEE